MLFHKIPMPETIYRLKATILECPNNYISGLDNSIFGLKLANFKPPYVRLES